MLGTRPNRPLGDASGDGRPSSPVPSVVPRPGADTASRRGCLRAAFRRGGIGHAARIVSFTARNGQAGRLFLQLPEYCVIGSNPLGVLTLAREDFEHRRPARRRRCADFVRPRVVVPPSTLVPSLRLAVLANRRPATSGADRVHELHGTTRDITVIRLIHLLARAPDAVRRCPEPECRRLFFRERRQRYCEKKCVNRANKRDAREAQKQEPKRIAETPRRGTTVPANVPAATQNEPETAQCQPTKKQKSPR
jgi:hypothetical protein